MYIVFFVKQKIQTLTKQNKIMNENHNNQPGFSGDGDPLNEVPSLGQPFQPFALSDLSKPIPITKQLKTKVMRWFPGLLDTTKVYLWSKFSDPTWHPNDYVKFENDEVTLHFIISSCGMLYPIVSKEPTNTVDEIIEIDKAIRIKAKVVSEELRASEEIRASEELRASEEIDTDEYVEDCDEAVLELDKNCCPLPENEESEETIPIKVREALQLFQQQCCKRNKTCPKLHYFIGTGKLKIRKKTYKGIHIYVEPDFSPDSVDYCENKGDKLFHQYNHKKLLPHQKQMIISCYLQSLEETVDASFDAPYPVGKREIIHP